MTKNNLLRISKSVNKFVSGKGMTTVNITFPKRLFVQAGFSVNDGFSYELDGDKLVIEYKGAIKTASRGVPISRIRGEASPTISISESRQPGITKYDISSKRTPIEFTVEDDKLVLDLSGFKEPKGFSSLTAPTAKKEKPVERKIIGFSQLRDFMQG